MLNQQYLYSESVFSQQIISKKVVVVIHIIKLRHRPCSELVLPSVLSSKYGCECTQDTLSKQLRYDTSDHIEPVHT